MLPRLPYFESRFIYSAKFEFWGSHFWRDSSEQKVSFFKCRAEGRGDLLLFSSVATGLLVQTLAVVQMVVAD